MWNLTYENPIPHLNIFRGVGLTDVWISSKPQDIPKAIFLYLFPDI